MEERDLNCSEEKSYYPIMGDFATKVTKIHLGKNKRELHLCNSLIFSCTPAGARTLDTLIKSQVLYQLSYKRILGLRGIPEMRLQR